MQIEKSVWLGQDLTAYNFDTNSFEKINVTLENLRDLDYNVKVGCMIFQNCLKNSNYNVLAALTEYNMGYGNLRYRILDAYCKENNTNLEDVLNDKTNTEWFNYRYLASGGDKHYVENVMSYYGDEECNIENIRPDGQCEKVIITNQFQKMY